MVCDVKSTLAALFIIFLCFFGIPFRLPDPNVSEKKLLFQSYTKKFNKPYVLGSSEYEVRFQNFKNSLDIIETLNRDRPNSDSALYGLTKFSDLSPEEFSHHHLNSHLHKRLRKHPNRHVKESFRSNGHHSNHIHKRSVGELPEKVDWRIKGAVTEVQNQKQCGACWAFSTIETVESMNFIKRGNLQSLSVQEAIDCAGNGNLGCDGGDTCSLAAWLAVYKIKIEPTKNYPLTLSTGTCKINKKLNFGVQVASNFTCDILINEETTLLSLLANHGPVAVAVNALPWQYYLGGVIKFNCDNSIQSLNHAVQIVGYDMTAPTPYYIVRNSWGTLFGDKGYLYLAIGSNTCGLATEVTALDVL